MVADWIMIYAVHLGRSGRRSRPCRDLSGGARNPDWLTAAMIADRIRTACPVWI
jgi:hypothetical protein